MNQFKLKGIFGNDKGPLIATIHRQRDLREFVGCSAGQLRARGFEVDPRVPDCVAVSRGGVFKWYDLKIDYKIQMS